MIETALRFNQDKLRIELIPLKILDEFYCFRTDKVFSLEDVIYAYQNGQDFFDSKYLYIDAVGHGLIQELLTWYAVNNMRNTKYSAISIFYDKSPLLEDIANVFTMGAKKYAPFNWAKGASWLQTLGSLLRHYRKYLNGEVYDEESKIHHLAHAIVNAIFLKSFYQLAPWHDDRLKTWLQLPKIVLDIDDVLADFIGGYKERYGISKETNNWYFSYKTEENLKELAKDRMFWVNLKVLHKPDFIPEAYVSSREIPVEWSMEFLEKNNFPCRPIYHVGYNASKMEVLKQLDTTIFIDDKYSNFVEAMKNGISAFLMHNTHNANFNVGRHRIYNLEFEKIFSNDLVSRNDNRG